MILWEVNGIDEKQDELGDRVDDGEMDGEGTARQYNNMDTL